MENNKEFEAASGCLILDGMKERRGRQASLFIDFSPFLYREK